ncbi:TetR/AcrR family transcriptional regulator [Planctomycetota bacterium]
MRSKESKKVLRKERERQARRLEILEAAELVFGRKGYHAATIEEIAAEAEFATGTIYNFFDSKESLYHELMDKFVDEFMGLFESKILSQADPRDAVGALIELKLSHFQEHRGFFRVFFETSPGSRFDPSSSMPAKILERYDDYIKQVSDIFKSGLDSGIFDEKLDPLYLSLSLEGVVNAFVAYWSRRGIDEPTDNRLDIMKNNFLSRIQIRI